MNTFEYYFNKLSSIEQQMHNSYIKHYQSSVPEIKNISIEVITDRVLSSERYMYIDVLKLIEI